MLTCWGDEEDAALEGLTPEAQVIYLRVLRRHMDTESGVVGIVRRISEADLAAVLRVRPDWGSNQRPAPPTRQFLRSRVEELKRAGLVVAATAPAGAKGLFFSLPMAQAHPSVQKRNNRGTTKNTTNVEPDFSEANQELAEVAEARNNQQKHEGTTVYLASIKPIKPNPLLTPLGGNTTSPTRAETDAPPVPTRRLPVPSDFHPDAQALDVARERALDAHAEAAAFIAHYTATQTRLPDWQAQFRKWLLNAHRFAARDARPPPRRTPAADRNARRADWVRRCSPDIADSEEPHARTVNGTARRLD